MSTDWDHESSGLRKENHLFLSVTFYCCCFPWLLNCGLKWSCAPNSSLHLLRGYPSKRTKAALAPDLRAATYIGSFFFPIENTNVFFCSHFQFATSACNGVLSVHPAVTAVTVRQCQPLIQCPDPGHSVMDIAGGDTLAECHLCWRKLPTPNGWGKMCVMRRRRKIYLLCKAIKDFNKGQ